MKIGIPELDELLGPLQKGSVILIESSHGLGEAIIPYIIDANKEKKSVIVILPKGSPEITTLPREGIKTLIFGRDVDPDKLYELLRAIRELPEGALLIAIRLDFLFLRQQGKSLYMFLEDLMSTIQERKLILIITLGKKSVSDRELAMFESMSTHVIDIIEEISELNVTHLLRIKKSYRGSTGFYTMKVKNGKIHLHELSDSS